MANNTNQFKGEDKVPFEVVMADQLLDQGFVTYPKAVIRCKDLTPQEKTLWGVIYSYKGDNGTHPNQETLAEDCGTSVASIKLWIKALKEKGFLDTRRDGFKGNNSYVLIVPKHVVDQYRDQTKKTREKEIEKVVKMTGYTINADEKQLILFKSESLGNGYKLSQKHIDLLYVAKHTYFGQFNALQYLLHLIDDKTKYVGKAKQRSSALKVFISYFKRFGVAPTSEEMTKLDALLSKSNNASPKNITDAMKKAKQENVAILSDKFNDFVVTFKQLAEKQSKTIAMAIVEQKQEEPKAPQVAQTKTPAVGSMTNWNNLFGN
jgi:predicted transcriptional regulator